MPQERPKQLDSPLLPKIFKYAGKAHVWVYRRTGGRIGGKWRIGAGFRKPVPTLLLEHRGRKSGKVFVTPLLYMFDGADVVIVASQGGRPEHPQWYRNLVANPDTFVEIGADRRAVHAVTADPDRAGAAVAETRGALRGLRQLPELDRARDSRRGAQAALGVRRGEARIRQRVGDGAADRAVLIDEGGDARRDACVAVVRQRGQPEVRALAVAGSASACSRR